MVTGQDTQSQTRGCLAWTGHSLGARALVVTSDPLSPGDWPRPPGLVPAAASVSYAVSSPPHAPLHLPNPSRAQPTAACAQTSLIFTNARFWPQTAPFFLSRADHSSWALPSCLTEDGHHLSSAALLLPEGHLHLLHLDPHPPRGVPRLISDSQESTCFQLNSQYLFMSMPNSHDLPMSQHRGRLAPSQEISQGHSASLIS